MLAQATQPRQSAISRALARAVEGGTEVYWHHGEWYASSSSQPGHWYKVDPVAGACECLAGQRGVYCKHLAAVFAARSQPCPHCQHVGDVVIEWARIYDTCHKYVARCRDRKACWQRWAEQQRKVG
jgi:hypothetical protein